MNAIGGGIVFDSVEDDEWKETFHKLAANMHCITAAEKLYARRQQPSSKVSGAAEAARGLAQTII